MALLFLAFALFAVGQAAAHRNGAQSAADAAALAAAQQAREELAEDMERALLSSNLADIDDLLTSDLLDSDSACAEADRFASRNEASVTSCEVVSGPPGYTVTVINEEALGITEVEGTEAMSAEASATAVIEAQCSLKERGSGAAAEPGQGEKPSFVDFECDDGDISFDPSSPIDFDIADFFGVHLRDR